MKIDPDEKELLESVKRGEWNSAGGARTSKGDVQKDRRLNSHLSSKDL